MSEYGFPWDSENIGTEEKPVLDRAYDAEQLQGVFKRFFSNGIFLDTSDALQTVYSVLEPTSEVNVWVKGGWCHVNGVFKHFTENTPVTFEPLENPSAQSMRMDAVVLKWDAVARDIIIDVKKGVQADTTNPMPPALTRNELVWELGIALIKQGVGTFDVLDNRLSPTDCGIVAPFESIDTSSLLAELQNAMDATVEAYQDALDGTLAGNLQSQIDNMNADGWVTSDRVQDGSITREKLSQEIQDSLSQSGATNLMPGVAYWKAGNTVTIEVYKNMSVQANTWTELGTLPIGYRPPKDLYFSALSSNKTARGYISHQGRVAIFVFDTATADIAFTQTFVAL